jgi:hypothetical protein
MACPSCPSENVAVRAGLENDEFGGQATVADAGWIAADWLIRGFSRRGPTV